MFMISIYCWVCLYLVCAFVKGCSRASLVQETKHTKILSLLHHVELDDQHVHGYVVEEESETGGTVWKHFQSMLELQVFKVLKSA